MNPMEKMMQEEKKNLKREILDLFDSFNRDDFLLELKEMGYDVLKDLGNIYSYSIALEIDNDVIYVYLDDKLSLRYNY